MSDCPGSSYASRSSGSAVAASPAVITDSWWLCSEAGSDRASRATFVELRVVEAEGERAECGRCAARVRADEPRVDPSRQKHTERHVADQLSLNGVLEQLADLLAVRSGAPIRLFGLGAVPVGELAQAIRAHLECVGGAQPTDTPNQAVWLRHGERREVVRQSLWSSRRSISPDATSPLISDANASPPGGTGVHKRLHTQPIARQEQAAAVAIPDAERPHAQQTVEHTTSPLGVSAQDDFGVTPCPEVVARTLELAAQLRRVEDLTVVDDRVRAVGDRQRPAPSLDVDHGQPPTRQANRGSTVLDVEALGVRSSMSECVAHSLQRAALNRPAVAEVHPRYSTHELAQSRHHSGRDPEPRMRRMRRMVAAMSISSSERNQRACPACDSKRYARMGIKNGFGIARCAACGTIFVDRLPGEDTAEDYESYYGPGNLTTPAFVDRRLDEFVAGMEGFRQAGRWLDVGCGAGSLLRAAARAGWNVEGTEVAPEPVDRLARKGFRVHLGDITALSLAPGTYDVVTLIEVIEHLPNPLAVLRTACSLLRPGGSVYVTTPHARGISARLLGLRWSVVSPPEHLQLFSVRGLTTALAASGLPDSVVSSRGVNPYELLSACRLPVALTSRP